MEDKKLITIITTVYNKAKYLESWAASLSKQTYLDKANILVIDDGSTDDSLNLLKQYDKKYNLKINLQINSSNKGLLYTIRKAYHQIDTKYFAVLDADDFYVSPQKLEKAVKFLENHEDYYAYASNYIRADSESTGHPSVSVNVRSQTFYEMKATPFFQTCSITFRNFFTPELLDRIDYFADVKGCETLRGDSFRYVLAFGFGKIFFENSIDAVWRCNIGIWGTLSKLEKDMTNLRAHWEFFDFYRTYFARMDSNAQHLIMLTAQFYIQSLSDITERMKNLSFFKFDFKHNFVKNLDRYSGTDNREKILSYMAYYGKQLSDIGIIIK